MMLTLMPKVKRRGEVLYLKSMDSFMDELSKKYKDLSKGLSHEEILSHGFSIEHISKECSNIYPCGLCSKRFPTLEALNKNPHPHVSGSIERTWVH